MVNRILAPDTRALDEEARARPPIHHPPDGFSDRFALAFTGLSGVHARQNPSAAMLLIAPAIPRKLAADR